MNYSNQRYSNAISHNWAGRPAERQSSAFVLVSGGLSDEMVKNIQPFIGRDFKEGSIQRYYPLRTKKSRGEIIMH